jgi:2-keto-3-deoxy-L-rhamnonate aldolase RhmA
MNPQASTMSESLQAALRAGRRVYGTMVVSSSPFWPPLLKRTGIDFVFIDTEHIALDRETVSWMCRAYAALGLTPIVRIPTLCAVEAGKMLDAGAHGVVAPYIETAEQVRTLVGAVKYGPLKGERRAAILAGRETMEPALQTYIEERNAGKLCIVNIESVPAVANLDEILAVEGLDVVLIGPHDLSCSLGIPEQYDDPRFDQTVREIIAKSRAAGVAAGVHMVYGNAEQELAWARHGANFILHSGDAFLVEQALRREVQELRRELGDDAGIIDERMTAI